MRRKPPAVAKPEHSGLVELQLGGVIGIWGYSAGGVPATRGGTELLVARDIFREAADCRSMNLTRSVRRGIVNVGGVNRVEVLRRALPCVPAPG